MRLQQVVSRYEGGRCVVAGGQVGKVVLVAVIVETVVVVATLLVNFLTKSVSAAWQVFLVPAAGVAIAGVKAGVDAVATVAKRSAPPLDRSGYPDYIPAGTDPPPRGRRSGGVSFVAVLAVLLVVCGGGGLAITAGIRYGYGWVTGNEPGTVVFQGDISGSSDAVKLTVTQVTITAHFTRVKATAHNAGRDPVVLPLFGNCQLVGAGGKTLDADSFRSDWSENVVTGVTRSGTITFTGELAPGSATLSFATVFGRGGGGSLVIRGIPIQAR